MKQRSFGAVDHKLAEAHFFLERLNQTNHDVIAANYYFSAFVSAARSVSWCLQAVMKNVEGFQEWYAGKQAYLREQPIARYFNNYRNVLVKEGELPITGGFFDPNSSGGVDVKHWLERPLEGMINEFGKTDAVLACKSYMGITVRLVRDCYVDFGPVVDPDQYYTRENLEGLGVTLEDIEESLGLPRGWTQLSPGDDSNYDDRLRVLRRGFPGSEIKWLFDRYSIEGSEGNAV